MYKNMMEKAALLDERNAALSDTEVARMKTISFFNNKGGVGKTTLTGNIAAYFSLELKKRVVVIDCDPQCNITQFILGDDKTISIYWPDKEDKEDLRIKTILDVVQPILDGDAKITSIRPLSAKTNRFGVDLIPGHPRFSLFEDPLSSGWTELPSGKVGGFRVTNWLKNLLGHLQAAEYDIALVDVGPSLGSLNRSVLLACDYFIAPLGADAFSVLGLRNISRWMSSWIEYYKVALQQSERLNPGGLERYSVPTDIAIQKGFIGYTLQQYIAKSKEGVRRPTSAYERVLEDIPAEINDHMKKFSDKNKPADYFHLGDVPNLYSLIPLAQGANAPIVALRAKDGLVGNQFNQAATYKSIIGDLAHRIFERI